MPIIYRAVMFVLSGTVQQESGVGEVQEGFRQWFSHLCLCITFDVIHLYVNITMETVGGAAAVTKTFLKDLTDMI